MEYLHIFTTLYPIFMAQFCLVKYTSTLVRIWDIFSYGYGSIPINTIFRGLFTSVLSQLWLDVNILGVQKWFWHTAILQLWLPSGKLSHSYGKIHHFSWENPLFLWPYPHEKSPFSSHGAGSPGVSTPSRKDGGHGIASPLRRRGDFPRGKTTTEPVLGEVMCPTVWGSNQQKRWCTDILYVYIYILYSYHIYIYIYIHWFICEPCITICYMWVSHVLTKGVVLLWPLP